MVSNEIKLSSKLPQITALIRLVVAHTEHALVPLKEVMRARPGKVPKVDALRWLEVVDKPEPR